MRYYGILLSLCLYLSSCTTPPLNFQSIVQNYSETSKHSEGLWPDLSESGINDQKNKTKLLYSDLKLINKEILSESEKLDYDVLHFVLENQITLHQFPGELLPMNSFEGFQIDIPRRLSKKNKKDIPLYIEQTQKLMEKGLASGVMPSKIAMKDVESQIHALIELFQKKENTEDVVTKLNDFLDFFQTKYLPQCRDSIGWRDLPNGKAWYEALVYWHTTTSQKPEEIHKIGLNEVIRIQGEMEKVIKSLKSKENIVVFFRQARSNKKNFPETSKETINRYEEILKRAKIFTKKYFKRLPQSQVEIREVEPENIKFPYNLFYSDKLFYVKTIDLNMHAKWEMETVVLHEAMPGHHLQIALAEELAKSKLRKDIHFTSYVEGWGQYVEILAKEKRFFKDKMSLLGNLSYENNRASRMVVDSGIHAMGWSYKRAQEYMEEASGNGWIDSLVTLPGRGLAYKVGQLYFSKLRDQAQAELKEKFDLSEFHDVVLRSGALPLPILEQEVVKWINSKKN